MNIKRFFMLLINAFIIFSVLFILTRSLWTLFIFIVPFLSLFIKEEKANG